MKVLTIIGLVLAAVLLLILLILLLPVSVTVSYTPEEGLKLRVKLLFFTVYKTKPSEAKEEAEGAEEQKPTPKLRKLSGELREMTGLIKNLLSSAGVLLRHLRLRRLQVTAVIAGGNAADTAMEYGMACSVLYPFIGYLKTVMHVNENGLDVRLNCDFEREQPELTLKATVSVLVLYGVLMALEFLKKQANE